MSKLSLIYIILALIIVSAVGSLLYSYFTNEDSKQEPTASQNTAEPNSSVYDPNTDSLSDQAIKEKFNCFRMTDDARDSDVFCNFPEIYRTGTLSMDSVREYYFCDDEEKAYSICDSVDLLEEFRQSTILRAKPYL